MYNIIDFPIKPTPANINYRFISFSHPYSDLFTKQLNKYGIDGLLDPAKDSLLAKQKINNDFFEDIYNPSNVVNKPYPKDEIDFSYTGAYSIYNWEIFFHAPMMIAENLSKNQRFEDAQKWFHYIFDPTISEGDAPQRFWKLKPFAEYNDSLTITDLINQINAHDTDAENQVSEWEQNPFNPHLIARMRLVAYMKNVLMKYLDNLIAWGDSLFRKDSIEYINEATQIYILAAQILGRRPVKIKQKEATAQDFASLKENLDDLSNIMIAIEDNLYGTSDKKKCENDIDFALSNLQKDTTEETVNSNDLGSLTSVLYYCIPENKKMLAYWDTVADRLFKIRHCQNIEGVERQLALFEAPIDPALLVKAAANGVSIGDALNDITASLPHYRFRYIYQKALELTNDVKSLGQSLLSALEKKDAETLALIRAGHETVLLEAVTALKEQNIKEAEENIKALEISKQNIRFRENFYRKRLSQGNNVEGLTLNENEELHLKNLNKAQEHQFNAQIISFLASYMSLIPQFGINGFNPTVSFGGIQLSTYINLFSQIQSMIAGDYNHSATVASIKAGYDRRKEDWTFQADSAEKEIKQIEKQITASQIRLAIAKKDLENHKLQIENSKEAKEFMENKYTNAQLYDWMSGEISSLYFRTYQLAYDMAKKAEKALQFELGKTETNYIQYGHWDSLKKGLLSGEKLQFQLRQTEAAYIEQNKREYEITKHISLALLNPEALMNLRASGNCSFEIPELLYDMDFPGQYFRRIKSVSITIPAVTGPYTGVNCKLTLLKNKIRKDTDIVSGYAEKTSNETRFAYDYIAKSVATSSGRNDAGMFEVNFNDERYLPFEGKGAIGTWQLELPNEFRAFDYDTISDVILTINYTAREGGIKTQVTQYLTDTAMTLANNAPLHQIISLKSEFSDNYNELLTDTNGTTVEISKKHIPYFFKDKTVKVQTVKVFAKLSDGKTIDNNTTININEIKDDSGFIQLEDNFVKAEINYSDGSEIQIVNDFETNDTNTNEWTIKFDKINTTEDLIINENDFEDIILILEYNVS